MDFSEKVKYVRMKRQLTREALADEMGVSRATLTRWERGEAKPQLALLGKFNDYCEKHEIHFKDNKTV